MKGLVAGAIVFALSSAAAAGFVAMKSADAPNPAQQRPDSTVEALPERAESPVDTAPQIAHSVVDSSVPTDTVIPPDGNPPEHSNVSAGQQDSSAIQTSPVSCPPVQPVAAAAPPVDSSKVAEQQTQAYRQVARIISNMRDRDVAAMLAHVRDEDVEVILRNVTAREAARILGQLSGERAAILSQRLLATTPTEGGTH